MNFKPGKSIRMKHFAGKYCNKGEIVEAAGGIITIKPEKSFTVFSFFEEDPLVLIYEGEEQFFISQCSVISIDYSTCTFNCMVENNEEFSNRRKDERYPTSVYGIMVNSPGKETIFINNISTGGISIKTKIASDINDKIEIEATLDGNYVYINGIVKWKKEHNNFFEYGLFVDESIPEIKNILNIIRKDHFMTVRNLKYENAMLAGV